MAKPIIEIEIADEQFKQFLGAFNVWNDKLGEMPEQWKAINDAMGDSMGTLREGALGSKEALAIAGAQASVIAQALKEATAAQVNFGRATSTSHKALKETANTAKGLASTIFGIGKWALKIGAGLGLGTGLGLFGLDALAGSALSRSRNAGSLGISPGQLASFQVNAQQFLGVGALQSAANAQIDISKAGQLAALGISYDRAQAESASDLSFDMLKAARASFVRSQQQHLPPMQSPAIQAYLALGGNIGDVRNAARSRESDLEEARRATNRDVGRYDFNRETAASWITLKKALDGAGFAIETSLIKALAPLAPQIADLSKDLSDFITSVVNSKDFGMVIDDAKEGLKELGSFLTTTNWKEVGGDIQQLGSEIVGALRFLHLIPQADDGKPKPTDNNNPLDPNAWKQKPLVQAALGLNMLRGDLGNFINSGLAKAGPWWQKNRDAFYGATEAQAKKAYDLGVSLGVTQPIAGAAGAAELRQPSLQFESRIAKGLSAIEGTWGSVNPDSGALGKWQFMPSTADSNLGPDWLRAHGSTSTAAGSKYFLGSQSSQLRAFNNYYNTLLAHAMKRTKDPKEISRLIGLGWYGGEGSWDYSPAKLAAKQHYGGREYPSLNEYAEKLWGNIMAGEPPPPKPKGKRDWSHHVPGANAKQNAEHRTSPTPAPSPNGQPHARTPIHVSITNQTAARVAVSMNAAAPV